MSRDKEIFQCSCCGSINKTDERYKPRGDDIYVILWCPKCKRYERQLYCGDSMDTLYELYNLNIDSNYY
jgi:hypothetical protein